MKRHWNPLGNLLAGIFLVTSAAWAQTTPVTCTNATLNGTYSLVLSGRDVLPSAALTKAFLGVGTAIFDGVSNVTINLTITTASSSAVAQKWSGTYSLPSSCLGTLTVSIGDVGLFTLIPYNSGNDFTITGQDGTYEYSGTGAPQPAACLASTFSGTFAFTGNGYAFSSGAITGVNAISGLLTFDGVSAVTANWTVATGSAAAADSLTGKYTISSTCTASTTLTDSNGVAYSLNMTLTTSDGANFGLVISNASDAFTGAGHAIFTNPGAAIELAAGAALPVVPGSLFSIYGSDLAAGAGQLTGLPLPTTIQKASVTINNEPVPLYFVSSGLINAQAPLDLQPGVATLVVTNNGVVSNSVAITVSGTAEPAVFVYGSNHAVAQNLPSYVENSDSNPIAVSGEIVVYFTGGGPVTGQSALTTGGETPGQQFPVTETYSATIAGVSAQVQFVGLVPDSVGGFYQANIIVPKVASGDRNLVLTVGGKASNTTIVSIQ
jgi:uncharacterized protein (TIGR03437 family)